MSSKVFIGLGSNLANPIQQIKNAISTLQSLPSIKMDRISGLYSSVPWGVSEQPDFINAVALLETTLTPWQLLETLQRIEKKQKRVKVERYGPRTIDCDILLFEGVQLNWPQLTIPHLYLEQRAFVIIPLAEIAPQLVLPSGTPIQVLADRLAQHGLVKMVEDVCL